MEIKNKNYGFKFAKTNLNTIFSDFTKNLSPIQLKLKKLHGAVAHQNKI